MALRPYIVGNWKMHGTRAMLSEARAIGRAAARYPDVDVGIAPPFTLLHPMVEAVPELAVGGQDCHASASGAFTGNVSASMLADVGARFTIVGHSERRELHREDNDGIRSKAEAAWTAGLSVILCVGESAAERDSGQAEAVVMAQLDGSLPRSDGAVTRLAVAYEPVWAIGTGRVPTVSDISAMHSAIRARLVAIYGDDGKGVRILYGGSVNAGNAGALLRADEVSGALVGGASLSAESFAAIISAANTILEG